MKRIIYIMTAVISVFLMLAFSNVDAASAGVSMLNPVEIKFGKEYTKNWENGSFDKYCYNKVTVDSKGILKMEFTKPLDGWGNMLALEVSVCDESGNVFWKNNSYYGKRNKEKEYIYYIGLNKGIYYVKIKAVDPGDITKVTTTNYTFTFTKENLTEIEPNETKNQATSIELNKMYKGYFGTDGSSVGIHDFYKFTAVQGKKYRIYVESTENLGTIFVYFHEPNKKGLSILKQMKEDEQGYLFYEFEASQSGTYFVELENYKYLQIPYDIAVYDMSSYIKGDTDFNKKIDINDAIIILKSLTGKMKLRGSAFLAADVTKDLNADVQDAITLLKYIVGKIKAF